MRFIHTNGRRREASLSVSSTQGPDLTVARGYCHAGTPAIARASKSLDHRVDAVAVPLCVGEPFQDKNANTFANHDAIRCFIEGTHFTSRRQGLRPAKAKVTEGRLHSIYPPVMATLHLPDSSSQTADSMDASEEAQAASIT